MTEAELGVAMKALAQKEGHVPRLPTWTQPPPDKDSHRYAAATAKILGAMSTIKSSKEVTSFWIAKKTRLSAHYVQEVMPFLEKQCLVARREAKVITRHGSTIAYYWRLL